LHASLPLAPVRALATATSVLIVIVCAADLYITWTAWNTHSAVSDYLAGLPGSSVDDLAAADNATTSAAWVNMLAIVASTTVFLTWLWRARVNSERMAHLTHRLSRGWTIAPGSARS
jgi:hypothetical protein